MHPRQNRPNRKMLAGMAGLVALFFGCGPDGSTAQAQETREAVVINGRALGQAQIQEIVRIYGVRPVAGDYWYDARSGLYGVVGYPAYGFMYPGHEFGPLSRRASRGDSGVVVNGRELTVAECSVWAAILGGPIARGSYWFDANGNAGYEGNPYPVVNLYVAAQARGMAGGGGGDNFWSSRFSAGNSDNGNTRGYVSVPGYGPVGYGFD